MGWSVKPYLGEAPIVLISAYDESINWDKTESEYGVSVADYVAAPWKYQDKLWVKDGERPLKIYMRAPTPFDLRDTEARRARADVKEGGTVEIETGTEAFDLFRRCLEDIRDYYPQGQEERLEIKFERGPGGKQWVSEETLCKIPYEVITEMGRYLRQSQQMGEDLKND